MNHFLMGGETNNLCVVNDVADKAQVFYTQLEAAQLETTPMIEKMETMNLKAPQVTTTDTDEIVQLTQQFHATLDEFES